MYCYGFFCLLEHHKTICSPLFLILSFNYQLCDFLMDICWSGTEFSELQNLLKLPLPFYCQIKD